MSLTHLSTKHSAITNLGIGYLNIVSNSLQNNHSTVYKNLNNNLSSISFSVFGYNFVIRLETDYKTNFLNANMSLYNIDKENNETFLSYINYDSIGNISNQYGQNDFCSHYISFLENSIVAFINDKQKVILS